MPALLVGQSHFVPNSATGLRLSWFTYRGAGPGAARPAANEGLGGPQGRWQLAMVRRLEHAAGATREHVDGACDVQRSESILRALAHDGDLIS